MIEVAKVKAFFFIAMSEGWAKGCKKFTIPGLPEYEAIEYRDGDLYLLDCYCVNSETNFSAGTTTIYLNNQPIWVMNYAGWYSEEGLRLLKKALLAAYEKQNFLAGRGENMDEGDMQYRNFFENTAPIHSSGDIFLGFRGHEYVMSKTRDFSYGWHTYSGMSLGGIY